MTDSQAVSLARSTFDDDLTGSSEEVPTLDDGVKIVGYRDERTAVLETATGNPYGLLEATTPLTTDAAAEEAISLDLVDKGDGYAPENPRVDVNLPASADEATELPEANISFAPVGADGVAAEKRSDRLIYPSIDTDTDYIVQPTELGAESFWQLRSADSPDTLRLRYSLPAGASLEDRSMTGQGIAAAIVLDGQIIGAVRPISATDATGRIVAVTSEVDGNDLVINADTQASDVQFPVLVDPRTESWYGSQTGGCGWGSPSGIWNQEQLGPRNFGLACGEGSFFGLTGFYIGAPTYYWYAAGDAFQISYWPRQNTYISKAVWTNFRHNNVYGTYGYTGLYCDYCGQWLQIEDDFWGNGGQTIEHNAEALYGDRAVMGLRFHTQVQSQGAYQGVEGVYLEIKDGQDPDPPIITNNSAAPVSTINGEKYYGWNVNPSFSASGLDIGFGTWNVAVLKDDGSAIWGPYWFDKNGNETSDSAAVCTGTVANPCKTYANVASAMHPFANLAEGDNSGRVVTTDAGGRYRYGTRVHIRKDTTGPVITPSGEAWDLRAQGYSHAAELNLQVADANVGVQQIDVAIDGSYQQQNDVGYSCSGEACTKSVQTGIDTSNLEVGAHAIVITATDALGNASAPLSWDFDVLPDDGVNLSSLWDDGSAKDSTDGDEMPPDPVDRAIRAGALDPGGPGWGISDNETDMFADQDFKVLTGAPTQQQLNIRKIVPWDIMLRDPWSIKHFGLSQPSYRTPGTDRKGRPYPAIRAEAVQANDPMGYGVTLQKFADWYRQAKDQNLDVLVSFEHTRATNLDGAVNQTLARAGSLGYRPSQAQYQQAIQLFRKAFPRVRYLGAWNEPNNKDQPTSPVWDRVYSQTGAVRVAQYWKYLYSDCQASLAADPVMPNDLTTAATCRSMTPEFTDDDIFGKALRACTRAITKSCDTPMEARQHSYFRDFKVEVGSTFAQAKLWGMHAYRSAALVAMVNGKLQQKPRSYGRVGSMVRRLPSGAELWISEIGGRRQVYQHYNTQHPKATIPVGTAGNDVADLLDTIPSISNRIQRLYVYQYYPDARVDPTKEWDSGLKSAAGSRRGAFGYFVDKACSATNQPQVPFDITGAFTRCDKR